MSENVQIRLAEKRDMKEVMRMIQVSVLLFNVVYFFEIFIQFRNRFYWFICH